MSGSEALRNESYHSIRHLGPRQDAVLLIIEMFGPISDRRIAKTLNWPINWVTPRRNELASEEMKLVVEAGEEYDPVTDRDVKVWRTQT